MGFADVAFARGRNPEDILGCREAVVAAVLEDRENALPVCDAFLERCPLPAASPSRACGTRRRYARGYGRDTCRAPRSPSSSSSQPSTIRLEPSRMQAILLGAKWRRMLYAPCALAWIVPKWFSIVALTPPTSSMHRQQLSHLLHGAVVNRVVVLFSVIVEARETDPRCTHVFAPARARRRSPCAGPT